MMSLRLAVVAFALLLAACASEPRAADPPPLQGTPIDAVVAGDADAVDHSCKVDADCEVKNVGNCCGYYPACVNRASPTFPERVQQQCEAEGTMSICGFPVIERCTCTAGRCEAVTGTRHGGEVR
jgi:hypothetical protein